MRTMNVDPFWRTSIGFDRLFGKTLGIRTVFGGTSEGLCVGALGQFFEDEPGVRLDATVE